MDDLSEAKRRLMGAIDAYVRALGYGDRVPQSLLDDLQKQRARIFTLLSGSDA